MMTIEENRRRILRTNILLIVFFCIMLVGVAGSVYYYQESKRAKTLLQIKNDSLVTMSANINSINQVLSDSKKELEKKKSYIDSLIRLSIKDNNLSILSPVVKTTDDAKILAADYEAKGYAMLKEGNLVDAKDYFNKSEKAYNGYHQVYEIWFLLYKNKEKLNDPEVKQQLLNQIEKDYSKFASAKTGIKVN